MGFRRKHVLGYLKPAPEVLLAICAHQNSKVVLGESSQ
jgi:hypothetical protein